MRPGPPIASWCGCNSRSPFPAARFSLLSARIRTFVAMTTTTCAISRRQLWRTRALAAVLDLATGSHTRAVAVLTLVSLLAFLPGFFQIPPVDRDEARFAQATKQML